MIDRKKGWLMSVVYKTIIGNNKTETKIQKNSERERVRDIEGDNNNIRQTMCDRESYLLGFGN